VIVRLNSRFNKMVRLVAFNKWVNITSSSIAYKADINRKSRTS
jgi:hypothetical protein